MAEGSEAKLEESVGSKTVAHTPAPSHSQSFPHCGCGRVISNLLPRCAHTLPCHTRSPTHKHHAPPEEVLLCV